MPPPIPGSVHGSRLDEEPAFTLAFDIDARRNRVVRLGVDHDTHEFRGRRINAQNQQQTNWDSVAILEFPATGGIPLARGLAVPSPVDR